MRRHHPLTRTRGQPGAMTKKITAGSMDGDQWVAGPGGIIDYTAHITKPADPIVQGIADFAYRSERYYTPIAGDIFSVLGLRTMKS
jgi:type 1 glutamine amidotransferase